METNMLDGLDEETIRVAKSYAGGFERMAVTREVFNKYGADEWPLVEFVSIVEKVIADIPPGKHGEAQVALEGDYEESTRLVIFYPDVESDAELGERIRQAVAYAVGRKADERAAYERLRAKYETGITADPGPGR